MCVGNHRWFFFFALIGFGWFFSASASAADYSWKVTQTTNGIVIGSYVSKSPVTACSQLVADKGWSLNGPFFVSNVIYRCNYRISANQTGYTTWERTGTGCTLPDVFDSATNSCITDPNEVCKAKIGTSRPFSKSGSAGDNYMTLTAGPKPIAIASQAGCFDGCMASTADQKCTTKTSGSYFCRGTAWFDGQSCSSVGTPGVDSSSTSAYPDSQQTTDTKPCNYVTNADGTQSCNSSNGTEKEGQICGTVSATGERICVDSPPSKQGLDITTNVKTETDENGNKTTTKTDTATTTKCVDIKSCISSSTTVTTVVKTDGNGKVTSATGSCTGANCPDKNTNPDGDGDGFGDCVTGDCGDGEGDGGGGQDWYEKGDDTYQSVMADFVEDAKQVPIVTSVKGFLDFAPAGSCPRYSVEAWVFTIQLDQWCTTSIPWSLIAAVVIGTAAFISFRIAFT